MRIWYFIVVMIAICVASVAPAQRIIRSQQFRLDNGSSPFNNITFSSPPSVTSYTLTFPGTAPGGTATFRYLIMASPTGAMEWLAPGTTNYILSTNASGVPTWIDPATLGIGGTGVNYNTATTQTTATPRTNALFNVAYSAGAAAANAAGATITSASGTGNVNATGLTVSATASGTGTATGLNVSASGGTNNYAAVFPAGNVGIGTSTPSVPLQVNGETFSNFYSAATTTAKPTYVKGRFFYDTTEHTFSYYNDEATVTMNIGQESWVRVRNVSGTTINNGSAVYINGFDATTNLPTVALARADALTTSDAIGIATHNIVNNGVGYITSFGIIHDINTASFSPGATLYLSATTAGAVTATRPSQPNFTNPIAYCGRSHGSLGSILVTAGKTRHGAMTTGAVGFGGSDGFLKENATNFLWDNTNSRLSLGAGTSPTARLHVSNTALGTLSTTTSTTDEHYAIKGEATGNASAAQVIGVWGDASNNANNNTESIGVLATGNSNTTTGQTNVALQVADGSITVGRTTEAPATGVTVEPATDGTSYTEEGPSGVIELDPFTAGDQILLANTHLSWANHITINNRYSTTSSIIMLQVLNTSDGTTNQAGAFDNANVTFSSLVDARQNGSFQISVGMLTFAALTVDGGASATDRDKIRIGYLIVNPSR